MKGFVFRASALRHPSCYVIAVMPRGSQPSCGEVRRDCGFTLVELLVVVAIVGLLAGIAAQSYVIYRRHAYDARVLSDIGNARVAEEAYYAQNLAYKPVPAVTGGPVVVPVPRFVVSPTVTIEVTVPGSENFVVTGTSSKGTGLTFTYDNTVGRIIGH